MSPAWVSAFGFGSEQDVRQMRGTGWDRGEMPDLGGGTFPRHSRAGWTTYRRLPSRSPPPTSDEAAWRIAQHCELCALQMLENLSCNLGSKSSGCPCP